MTIRAIDVPAARLHVIDAGDPSAPTIVLLHAWVVDSRAWDDVAPLLVDAGYRVGRFDTRGFGFTEATAGTFTPAADVIAVLDALGIGRAAIVGNSGGGRVATEVALDHPDRIVALVTIGSGVRGYEVPLTPEEHVIDDRSDALDATEPLDVDALVAFDIQVWLNGPFAPADRTSAALQARMEEMDRRSYPPFAPDMTSVYSEPPAVERLDDLRVPVMAIIGELDFPSINTSARYLIEHVPDGRLVAWPDVAHLPSLEVPERLAAALIEFLAPVPRWS
jgi:pimeloyl-ACP methyl ester carboxylesterase